MKKAILYTLIGGVLCVGQTLPVHAATDPSQTIMISEFQTGGASDATQEFVELYNPQETEVDVTGWQLQYRAASATPAASWPGSSVKATFACVSGLADCRVVIRGHERIVLATPSMSVTGSLHLAGGFSGTGGQLRLLQPGTQIIVHDVVGYGAAATSETSPTTAPAGGKSSKRIINDDGQPVDTGNNSHDFLAACGDPTPGHTDSGYIPRTNGCEQPQVVTPPTDEPESTNPDTPVTSPTDDQSDQGAAPIYLPLVITEIFADPASPQQDSTDEFIELYNPNDSEVNLQDYRLQTGSDYRYSFTLGDTPLGPHKYLAIPSAVSKLSLANAGSGVRLIDPTGAIVYEAPNYGDAKEGQSWMQDESGWKWTLTPTPDAANIASAPQPKIATSTTTAAKKKAAATKTTKVTAPKQAKAPAAKKTTAEKPKTQPYTAQASAAANPQYWLLVPLGTLIAGYAAYEYRHGISKSARTGWAKIRGKEPPHS